MTRPQAQREKPLGFSGLWSKGLMVIAKATLAEAFERFLCHGSRGSVCIHRLKLQISE